MNHDQQTSPLKAIKAYCRSTCCCDDMDHWKNCEIEECQFHPFRFGKNPFRKKREVTPEQQAALVERMQKARMAKS